MPKAIAEAARRSPARAGRLRARADPITDL